MTNTKKCFVIAPIGTIDSPTRKRSDKILKHIIRPVALECGYAEPIRADQISTPGLITTQIIEHIVEDDMVIADLTESNPNVFYELAIRHAIRKPFVHLIEEGHKLPFDVAPARTIEIDHTDLDSVEESKEELRRQILAAEEGPDKINNPISIALDLKALYRSDDPEERSLAELMSHITAIGTALRGLDKRLTALDKLQELDGLIQKATESEKVLAKIESTTDGALGYGFTSLDDVIRKLDDLEGKLNDIENSVDLISNE
jgi:hypothetical protein